MEQASTSDNPASASRVEKIEDFEGSRPTRELYVYLPPGYNEYESLWYPVIYMHDGQNCFESFIGDSFAHSTWMADRVADKLISKKRMRPCIIVGVSNGGSKRMREYRPPYTVYQYPPPSVLRSTARKGLTSKSRVVAGLADQMAEYYKNEVAPFINQKYRTLTGPKNTATCGSSMGGLFTTYLAWSHSDFAMHHAALSPSYWVTRRHDSSLEVISIMEKTEKLPIRLWIDSGTKDTHDRGDDGMFDTITATNALARAGYDLGTDFVYFLDQGATHTEAAWAGRLDKVFKFLFPYSPAE